MGNGESNTILWLTPWYPLPYKPAYGSFIEAHRKAVVPHYPDLHCLAFTFGPVLKPNAAKGIIKGLSLVEHGELFGSKGFVRHEHLSSRFWKLFYNNPYYIARRAFDYVRQNKLKVDLVHGHIGFPAGVAAGILAEKLGVPFVVSEHWSGMEKNFRHPIKGLLSRRVLAKASAYTAVSDYLLQQLAGVKAIKGVNRSIIPNVIYDAFSLDIAIKERPSLVAVMNLSAPKRPDLFVEAYRSGKIETPLVIFGDGPMRAELQALVSKESLPIYFKGQRPRKEIIQAIREAKAVIHASETETFGMVAAEALASGVPVLASNVGALPEIIRPHLGEGILIDNTISAWVEGIKQVTEQSFDREQIALINQGRYQKEKAGEMFHQLYQKILGSR